MKMEQVTKIESLLKEALNAEVTDPLKSKLIGQLI